MTTDTYSNVADDDGGTSEMAELDSSDHDTTDALDELCNTTPDTGKGGFEWVGRA